jgi:glycerol-3-phosphate acyltransferase PlsY
VERVLALLTAYLLGSLAWGLWIGRLRGVDVRRVGSGNLGATNVARAVGRGFGLLVLSLDVAKGLLAVFLGRAIAPGSWLPAACGFLAILGHVTSPWAGFRGGKGVATGAGASLALLPGPTAVALVVFLVAFGTTRIVSVGSLAAAAALPVAAYAMGGETGWALAYAVAVALVVWWRHRGNLRRLLRGEEPRFRVAGGGRG